MTKLAEIEAAALRLSQEEQLHLAGKLLASTPPPHSASADELLAEALRREGEIESGAQTPLSEDAFWAGLRRARK